MSNYKTGYDASRALVIGINAYQRVAPLNYATHDAEALARMLVDQFAFPAEHVTVLLDSEATKERIMRAFLAFADDCCAPDDRLVFFFAGHGHTRTGLREEVGFLVPVEGSIDDLASLIRWDDLTRNSELIPAKHLLFIMDACYGGLAFARALPAGTQRFLRDMTKRFSRQAISAGKADEVVADSGGPLPNHSVFTGHLLEGLSGKAETIDGVLTANGLMSYVYEHVSKDPHSRQTPHYGTLDGQGDFVFKGLPSEPDATSQKVEDDKLLTVPASDQDSASTKEDAAQLVSKTKELLAEQKYVIQLHDLLISEVRRFLAETAGDSFKVQGQWNADEFRARLKRYEDTTARLQSAAICISYWGEEVHRPVLERIVSRMTDRLEPESGLVIWSVLRWYPLLLLSYSGGIAAVAAGKYENLRAILETKVRSHRSPSEIKPLVSAYLDLLTDSHDAFKTIPGHERNYVPRSEYLFKLLQPALDDILFLGRDYEQVFDRFEVLLALTCADKVKTEMGQAWGPFGRFAYKFRSRFATSHPYGQMVREAADMKGDWPPLQAGLFGGSVERFSELAAEYGESIKRLSWL